MNEMFIANRCIFNRSKFYQGAQVSKLQVYNKKTRRNKMKLFLFWLQCIELNIMHGTNTLVDL